MSSAANASFESAEAGEALFRQDGPDVAVELECVLRARCRGGYADTRDAEHGQREFR